MNHEDDARVHYRAVQPSPRGHDPLHVDSGETSDTLHESPPSSSFLNDVQGGPLPSAKSQAKAKKLIMGAIVRHRHNKGKPAGAEPLLHGGAALPPPPPTPTRDLHDVVAQATAPRAALLGQPRPLPKFLLARGYHSNSYFAQRLCHVMLFVVAIDLVGVLIYWLSNDLEDGGLYIGRDFSKSLLFRESKCSDEDTAKFTTCRDCNTTISYSTLVYHLLPIVVLIGLPASGVRAFEPFKRELRSGSDHSKSKVKRSVFLQLCELMGVLVVVLNAIIFVYFVYTFLRGNNFNCNETRVHLYATGAVISYFCIFMELTYFARFREHLKMQLGAFKEADQTGDIRSRLVAHGSQYRNERAREKSDIRKKLFKATELGNTKEVAKLLAYAKTRLGDDFADDMYTNAALFFKTFGHSKKNPLHVASYQGNLHLMDLLVRHGFHVNAFDKVSRVRFSTGDLFWYFAQFFISKPAQTDTDNAVSVFKTTLVTPLFCAVSTGQVKAVQWLIKHGADVNLHCQSSYSSERVPPLFAAESPEIVALLLEAGANHLEIPDPGHMNTLTVLQLAYMRGNIPVARELEEWGGDVALTPLHTAAANGPIHQLSKLLHHGADPNALGEHGYVGLNRRTPLHWAAINGHTDAVDVLLAAGADANFQDVQGRTPLHWAARVGHVPVLHALLRQGADPSTEDHQYMTPMLCAALAPHAKKDVFMALVEHGADINDELPNGDTPLHLAMKCEHRESALTLVACGADTMKTNLDGLRPVDCTASTTLQFEVKRAAGTRDVMISYTHSHSEFALKLRASLEAANITTWLDQMDPSGIGGGSVWREEIARGIQNASLVICILTEDYASSEWCLKELALAKECGTPIMAVSTEHAPVTDELQVYVYTRQMVPFEPAITSVDRANPRNITYTYHDAKFTKQFRLLLDGVRDEIVKHGKRKACRIQASRRQLNASMLVVEDASDHVLDLASQTDDFVFLCHGDHHRAFAQRIVERLQEQGVACFFDGVQGHGDDMAERIHVAKEAMLKCACVIVIISNRTAASEIVRDQLAFAEDKGKPILPIMLNELELTPDKLYSLSRTPLLHFTPELGFNASFNGLMDTLREHVCSAPSSAVSLSAQGSRLLSARSTLMTAAVRVRTIGRLEPASADDSDE